MGRVSCVDRNRCSRVKVQINGSSGDKIATSNGMVNFTIRSLKSSFEMQCVALVLPRVENITPTVKVTSDDLAQFWNLDLADPQFNVPQVIDIILSAQDYAAVLLNGLTRSPISNLVAQNTQLGWVVFGGSCNRSLDAANNIIECYHTQVYTDRLLRRFWELEEIREHTLTRDEKYVEDFFQSTTCRTKEGRYVVRLPMKPDADISQLTSTKYDAVKLLQHLRRRLSRDSVMGSMYEEFMNDYLSLQHMELINDNAITISPACYLPHHGVWKESSTATKLRVVFNASKRCCSGKSLNDCLFSGPKLQNDLTSVVLNWRRYRIAVTADIAKMYRQILVDEQDLDLKRIVWHSDSQEKLSHFRHKTVTYGMNCAPYLAMKVLQTLAADEQHNFPEVTQILLNKFYVDDVLTGGDSVVETCRRRVVLQKLLQAGGFSLRKWNSNSSEVLKTIDSDHLEVKPSHEFQLEGKFHTLGLVWVTKQDCLTYKLTGIDCNDILPEALQKEWVQYRNELKGITATRIPCWLHIGDQDESYELHTFADASTHAYAAIIYLKVVTKASVRIHLLMSKTRVAPLKKVAVPRLELCATTSARLLRKVQSSMKLASVPTYMWSDSTTVVWWIRSDPGNLKDFVANQVHEVQNLTAESDWNYVRSTDNPADCASRGLNPIQLLSHCLWWHGPEWLSHS
ncbi:uncharacterized protein LOC118749147 [Rhagoletis pomonella]|uniref:uncharacterized protein LOC118749147 n=1 Tax=Rhagoletis pomonella TaxID=28610 RepID=UPI00177DF8B0|nr:uncharacterized protein LOC118749147 [Rhagoletis pomonella]